MGRGAPLGVVGATTNFGRGHPDERSQGSGYSAAGVAGEPRDRAADDGRVQRPRPDRLPRGRVRVGAVRVALQRDRQRRLQQPRRPAPLLREPRRGVVTLRDAGEAPGTAEARLPRCAICTQWDATAICSSRRTPASSSRSRAARSSGSTRIRRSGDSGGGRAPGLKPIPHFVQDRRAPTGSSCGEPPQVARGRLMSAAIMTPAIARPARSSTVRPSRRH